MSTREIIRLRKDFAALREDPEFRQVLGRALIFADAPADYSFDDFSRWQRLADAFVRSRQRVA